MKSVKTKTDRRLLLKSVAGTAGAVIAGKALPKSWSKPIVDSVLLPAHAATSDTSQELSGASSTVPPDVNPCIGETMTIDADQFAIDIVYDGVSSPYFSIRNSIRSRLPVDTIVAVNKDPDIAVGPDRNWETGDPRIEQNVADGFYTRTSTRIVEGQLTGDTSEISFCIATSGEGVTRTLTVTLVSIREI